MNGKIIMPDNYLFGHDLLSIDAGIAYAEKVGSWITRVPEIMAACRAECEEHGISIAYLLALMQKEQSAFWSVYPPGQRAQDWLLGYGCPEGGGRDVKYQGAVRQIQHAVQQLARYPKVFDEVKCFRNHTVKLYDSEKILNQYHVGKFVSADSYAEAASLLYNPRIEGLVNQVQFIERILKEAK